MCWDLIKNGFCARGLACPWRHSAEETEHEAQVRREGILSKLTAGNPAMSSAPPAPRMQPPANPTNVAGYNKGRRIARPPPSPPTTPVRDWTTTFDTMLD